MEANKPAFDLAMTSKEVEAFLNVASHVQFKAGMISADALGYGSLREAERSGEEYRLIFELIGALPKRVVKTYNAKLNKAKADDLRAKADRIEAGKDVDEA